jgi:hypothetical protein
MSFRCWLGVCGELVGSNTFCGYCYSHAKTAAQEMCLIFVTAENEEGRNYTINASSTGTHEQASKVYTLLHLHATLYAE